MNNDQSFSSNKKTSIALAVVSLIVVGFAAYFFIQYQNSKKLLSDPNLAAQEELKTLKESIGKHMIIAPGNAQLAKITDKKKLSQEPFLKNFFSSAENGDQVLIVSNKSTQYWYLYRSNNDKLINFVNFTTNPETGNQNAPQKSSTSLAREVAVSVVNGTTVTGLGGKIGEKIKLKFPNIKAGKPANAKNNDYKTTLVIDLSGKNKAFVQELARFLNGKVSTLPEGEEKAEADIIVIAAQE